MKYTTTLLKTSKEDPKDEASRNAKFLIRGGFISKNMAGAYAYLPIGLRVLRKIEGIIREEMNKVGTELFLTALCAQEYYQKTGRWDTIDVVSPLVPVRWRFRLVRRPGRHQFVSPQESPARNAGPLPAAIRHEHQSLRADRRHPIEAT